MGSCCGGCVSDCDGYTCFSDEWNSYRCCRRRNGDWWLNIGHILIILIVIFILIPNYLSTSIRPSYQCWLDHQPRHQFFHGLASAYQHLSCSQESSYSSNYHQKRIVTGAAQLVQRSIHTSNKNEGWHCQPWCCLPMNMYSFYHLLRFRVVSFVVPQCFVTWLLRVIKLPCVVVPMMTLLHTDPYDTIIFSPVDSSVLFGNLGLCLHLKVNGFVTSVDSTRL